MAQILVFVDPANFGALIGNNYKEHCKFAERINGRLVNLNSGNSLLYVPFEECPYQGEFDETRARSGAYLIIPESLGIPVNYEPNQDFAMLVHKTNAWRYAERYNALRHKNHCWVLKEDSEIAGSSFAVIASQLRPDGRVDFNEAWKSVTRNQINLDKGAFLEGLRNRDIATLSLPTSLRSVSAQFAELQEMLATGGKSPTFQQHLERFRDSVQSSPKTPNED